ncbi:hypothetical protein G7Y89_g2929 [Cudoniella acicularis]|uniref:Carbohydrate kinase PfkB domain-containing protein n=1 Tax=Cudoniella acicularis TaxID=354080 RepID=A0A8H4RUG2_9HELO|nr:hypothetical protein G7Y89_g2929 [Cudoniella acicularis]
MIRSLFFRASKGANLRGFSGNSTSLLRPRQLHCRRSYSSEHQLDNEGRPPIRRVKLKLQTPDQLPMKDRSHGLIISADVAMAVANGSPVVALESTIYTHGFPYPQNVDLALDLEATVRTLGGIPATIGVVDGVIRVGLTREEIITLASAAGKPETMKVSRRDIPYIVGMGLSGKKLHGGTTVAATMMIARQAGIRVFGTGGLGGVHRGGQDSMDISADLTELGRTRVAVVSSGCKSFLDIPRTLEYLETQGVTVCTFADGRTGEVELPAFYSRESGVKSPLVFQTPQQAANMIYAGMILNTQSGMLFANPIPEEYSIPKSEMDVAIDQAVREAAEKGFHGHTNTPFILSRIKQLTEGRSIPANRALIMSNVAIATEIAIELSRIRKYLRDGGDTEPSSNRPTNRGPASRAPGSQYGDSVPSKAGEVRSFQPGKGEIATLPEYQGLVVPPTLMDNIRKVDPRSTGDQMTLPSQVTPPNIEHRGKKNLHEIAYQLQDLIKKRHPYIRNLDRTARRIISTCQPSQPWEYSPLRNRDQLNALVNKFIDMATAAEPSPPASHPADSSSADIVVFGSVAVDLSCDFSPEETPVTTSSPSPVDSPQLHTSNVAAITPSIGGVGHNVAHAVQLVSGELSVRLCSGVGSDLAGKTILDALQEEGLDTTGMMVYGKIIDGEERHFNPRTAQYIATNDRKKDLVLAMADMKIFEDLLFRRRWIASRVKASKWLVVDANFKPNIIDKIVRVTQIRNDHETRIAFEPVSTAKSTRVFSTEINPQPFPNNLFNLTTPNHHELAAMHTAAKENGLFESDRWWKIIDALGIPSTGARDRFVALTSSKLTDEGVPLQSIQLLPFIPTILTKLGSEGVLMTELLKPNDPRLTDPAEAPYILSRCANGSEEIGGVYMRLFSAVEVVQDVVSVNGVGDTFLGVLIAGLARGKKLGKELIDVAQKGAVMTLRSKEAVSPELGVLKAELDDLVDD